MGSFCFTFHMACNRSLLSPILHKERHKVVRYEVVKHEVVRYEVVKHEVVRW